MAAKTSAALREPISYDVKTLSGDELHNLDTRPDSDYLVIDLGSVQKNRDVFNKTMQVAMSAAVNAVLASLNLPESKPTKISRAAEGISGKTEKLAEKAARSERHSQRREQLNARILSESVWLTARELSEKASFKNTNPSAGPNRWKSARSIFALQLNGKDKYPEYALDEGYRPIPVVKQVIALFGDKKTPWGLAIWFGSQNSWLGGRKPKDVLTTMPDQVMLAAQAEMDGGKHG
ncbi:antitoxin Xre/MbcA/ParS toxin-binding domain-containing protein [Winslowiella iniecta]|uniref:Integrase n=1 Tax=Winslowiella iniecta TaxID=1560201 RepID=A0A0L7T4Z1_9GAMM|nr:antitoxin Xre/MbcA/ParS toxin-binding domain-containing protein [Winslowiella iniecta]KOC90469.1 integrase [Winslowiella iniecta]KOC93651.1 integrase [Winslowiella iniecta]